MTDCRGVAAAAHGCFIAPQLPPLKQRLAPTAYMYTYSLCFFFMCVFRLASANAKLHWLHLFYCLPKSLPHIRIATPLAIIEALVLQNGLAWTLSWQFQAWGLALLMAGFCIWVLLHWFHLHRIHMMTTILKDYYELCINSCGTPKWRPWNKSWWGEGEFSGSFADTLRIVCDLCLFE